MTLPLSWMLAALTFGLTPAEVPNPRTQGRWVQDGAGVLTMQERRDLDVLLTQLEKDTGVEMPVVTVQDVPGTPKEFATALFNHWGVGKADADNGVLVLLVMGQRRLEMETGYGVEPILPDGWLGVMQNQSMVPQFKRGQFGAGLMAGLRDVDARLRQHADEAREGSRRLGAMAGVKKNLRPFKGAFKAVGWALGLGGLVGAWALWQARVRRKERTCDTCQGEMELMPESVEDKHLSQGQQMEERLGSINYDVFYCFGCKFTRVVARNKWISGYSRCSACSHKTMTTNTRVLVPPTYVDVGVMEVETNCRFCHRQNRYTKSIPRRVRSTTSSGGRSGSSGGGGGSFGGGRSGGGGAGSSW
jgi:uncharacterized protein